MNKATLDNTVFVTVCDYLNPEEVLAPLKRTADYFGVPLSFASYGQPYKNHLDKFLKVQSFLEEQPESVKYAFFVDCRDTLFTDTAENILAAFNALYTGGVMTQSGGAGLAKDMFSWIIATKIASAYTWRGFACSGGYCGNISAMKSLLGQCIELHHNLVNRDLSDPRVALYLSDRCCETWFNRAVVDDEFLFHLIQTSGTSLIKPDLNKELMALFGNRRPAVHTDTPEHIPLVERRQQFLPHDIRSVGTAKIIHSPRLSRHAEYWNSFIEQEIFPHRRLTTRTAI